MGDRVVVEEQDAVGAERLDGPQVLDHLVDRPRAEAALVVGLHGAVLAGMRAAAREDDRPVEVHAVEPARLEGVVLEQRQRRVVDARQVAQAVPLRWRGRCRGCGRRQKSASTCGQTSSASPATTASACCERLLGGERHPGAAEHDAAAAGAEVVGEVVGALDLRTHGGDADDVARRRRGRRRRTARRRTATSCPGGVSAFR